MHSEQRNVCIIDKANPFIIKINYPPFRFHRRQKVVVVAMRQTFLIIAVVLNEAPLFCSGCLSRV